jgi:AcrR family transcriptional regulator
VAGEWKSTEGTRARILAGARRVFSQAGYAGATVRELARAGGVNQPSLYHHFGNKENLYRAALFESHHRLEEYISARLRTDSGLFQEVTSLFEGIGDFHRREPDAMYLLFSLAFTAPEQIQREFSRVDRWYLKLLRNAFRRHGRATDRERLYLLHDLLRSTLLGLTAPAMRTGRTVNKRKSIELILDR